MNKHRNTQTNKQFYLNFAKNLARLGAGSALILLHFAVIGGTAFLSKRSANQNNIKALLEK